MDAIDAGDLLEVARRVADEAAGLAVRMRADGVGEVDTKTTETDVVTAADRAVERLVVSLLAEARPGDAVLAEESGAVRSEGGSRVRWILDPIDGTVNYVYGLPQYAVSLAAEVDGEVVAGVVGNPVTGEQWYAAAGRGAYRGSRRLRCSPVTELGQTLVATGFGYDARRRAHQAKVLAGLLPRVRDVRRLGAASLDLCFAAEGRVDAYFEKGLSPWDWAAGVLIAREAGLLVTGLAGRPAGDGFVVAAPPGVYQQLHDELVALDAAGGP
ncbi:MAG TPA: inositol monophosphatase family protein [Micromonosporaceae bacterium]